MIHIVKREGHTEKFDERKVYASCYAACLNVQLPPKQAEKICEAVTKDITRWIKTKEQVRSTQIFSEMIRAIKKHNKDAAFMYETHRDIA